MFSATIRKPQFAFIMGSILLMSAMTPNESAVDQVINDDLIVQGSAAVGIDAMLDEDFGFDTVRLKENNLRIHFEDTSNSASFPANDWRILINDSANGGQNFFRIEDSTHFTRPFTVFANSSNNSLNVTPTGVGVGAPVPTAAFHVLANGVASNLSNAMIRGEVTSAFAAQDRTMLDLRNNGAVIMNLIDTSAVGALPYQIRAASDRLSFQQFSGNKAGMIIFGDGSIRYVANAKANLTVTGNGNLNVIGQSGGGNLNVIGSGPGTGNLWVNGNVNYNGTLTGVGDLKVMGSGAGTGDLFVNGDITYNGSLNGPSDRNLKENFSEIDPLEILAKVAELPITKWNYIADEDDTPHLGPMAQDFYAAFRLGDDDKRIPLMDNSGVALAAIQGLNRVVQAKDQEIEDLKKALQVQSSEIARSAEQIAGLNERLERLESLAGAGENRKQD